MKLFVQMKQGNTIETVDEFPANTRNERKYAREMLHEYRISDSYSSYYLSQRACKDW